MCPAVGVDLVGEWLGVADRADLGGVTTKWKSDRPVDDRTDLPGESRDLAHVVAARHPPGDEAAELQAPDLADGLVAPEVDEGLASQVVKALRLGRDAEFAGDVVSDRRPLAHGHRGRWWTR